MTVVYRHARMMSAQFFAAGLPRYGIDGILANEGFKAYARMVDALLDAARVNALPPGADEKGGFILLCIAFALLHPLPDGLAGHVA